MENTRSMARRDGKYAHHKPLSFTSSPIAVSRNHRSFFSTPNLLDTTSPCAPGFVNGSTSSSSDAELGFPGLNNERHCLAGTVPSYQRHVFLCYKNPSVWPPRIEASEFDRLPRLLSAALVSRKGVLKNKTIFTICEGNDGTETLNGDVMIFPDMVRYRRLTHFDVDTFVEEVIVKNSEWRPGNPEKLVGSYIFVCCHGSRDRRCGVYGPALVDRFKDEVRLQRLEGDIYISPCSHIGGHKYAGNVIIFGSSIGGVITGHWYGYVTPDDVPILLEQHILTGQIVHRLWRGQMGTSGKETKLEDQLLQLKSEKAKSESNDERKQSERDNCELEACGPDGSDCSGCVKWCCQSRTAQGIVSDHPVNKGVESAHPVPALQARMAHNSTHCDATNGTTRFRFLQMLHDNWEREDTHAAIAVLCAMASVAVAYCCYKNMK